MGIRKQQAQEDGQPPAAKVVVDDELHRVEPFGRRAGERGVALLEERGDALREIGRLHELGLRPRFRVELLRERRGLGSVEQPLRLPHGTRRHRGEELGDLCCALGELGGRHHLGDESPLERLGRRQPPACRQPLEGARCAEQPAREPRAAGVGHEPDADERRHERRLVRGNPHVARKRE